MHANLVMLVVILVKLMLLSSSYAVLSAVCLTKCSTYRNTCALCWPNENVICRYVVYDLSNAT